jgi:YD repeat-containing protein
VGVGTNGGAAWTRPSTAPARSDTALVTSYAYNAMGLVQDVTDPRGLVTRTLYDGLGRVTKAIQNYTGGTPGAGNDVAVEYGYDGDGHTTSVPQRRQPRRAGGGGLPDGPPRLEPRRGPGVRPLQAGGGPSQPGVHASAAGVGAVAEVGRGGGDAMTEDQWLAANRQRIVELEQSSVRHRRARELSAATASGRAIR